MPELFQKYWISGNTSRGCITILGAVKEEESGFDHVVLIGMVGELECSAVVADIRRCPLLQGCLDVRETRQAAVPKKEAVHRHARISPKDSQNFH